MKTLCLAFLIAVGLTGCSRFTKTGRMDRAYYKQLAQVQAQKEKRRNELMKREQAQMPSMSEDPSPGPFAVSTSVEGQ